MNNVFQSKAWEDFKLQTGYQKSYRILDILVLEKKLPFGFSMLYSPMVGNSQWSEARSQEFSKKIRELALKDNAIFYRLELDVLKNSRSQLPTPYIKSFEEMQPEHTLILDLEKSEEELLAQMRQKGRYNIRLAEKRKIKVSSSCDWQNELKSFYALYEETAKRHKITYRSKTYFEKLLENLSKNGYSKLYKASAVIDSKEIVLASAIVVFSGQKAIYLFGSSSDRYKSMMAPYLLQWQMIKEAKEAGYLEYDFFGIAPNEDPKHPWSGVTRFKKQFGGDERALLGSFDWVFKPFVYRLFKLAERIRR